MGQRKILFISRLNEREKLQHIYNLILLCKGHNFNIDVAGIGEQKFIKKTKEFAQINNVVINFIGKINTLEYLNKNLNNILFVAGVGQVIFEAASFNIPCLVITNHKTPSCSKFITKDNVRIITAYNCVLNKLKLSGEDFKVFVTDIPNNLEKYSVKDYVEKNYSIENIMNIYMKTCNLK
ncbi:MAG: glycosyltransferase family 4 protein [Endomicrobiaceae bacterium]|nr:glycosyltransferase family 4 protein [Endomicrobiaceae bacterium]